jgi:hypothetical protein
MAAMTWPGQFNFDFMGLLLLLGLSVSWSHQHPPCDLVLGLFAVFDGLLPVAMPTASD